MHVLLPCREEQLSKSSALSCHDPRGDPQDICTCPVGIEVPGGSLFSSGYCGCEAQTFLQALKISHLEGKWNSAKLKEILSCNINLSFLPYTGKKMAEGMKSLILRFSAI